MRANYKGGARMRARQLTDGAEGAQDGSEPKPRSHDRSPIAPPRFGLVRAHKELNRANVHAPISLERPTTRPASCKRASRDQRKTQHGDPPWQDLIGRYLITRNLIRFDIPQHALHNLISVGSCGMHARATTNLQEHPYTRQFVAATWLSCTTFPSPRHALNYTQVSPWPTLRLSLHGDLLRPQHPEVP